jgi:hypothetical protein
MEDYAREHDGAYPRTLDELVQSKSISRIPENPFTHQPMREITFGSQPCDGEYTYLTADTNGKITGYVLLIYGSSTKPGLNVNGDSVPDHVVASISSPVNPKSRIPNPRDILREL